jgi:hypothetical protein
MLAKIDNEKLEFLIRRRFPDHWTLRNKELPDPRVEALQRYETELTNLPQSAFDEHYIQAVEEYSREQADAEARADRLEFFNQPDAAADFRFWCHLEHWTLDETVALLLGKDPRKVSPLMLSHIRHKSPFRQTFEDLRSKLIRAKHDGKLKERDTPSSFIEWAEKVGVAMPGELLEQLQPATDVRIDGRKLTSLHMLIIGMATKFYGYDPSASRNPVTTRIVDDLALLGLVTTPETVRTHLKEASKLLSPNTNKKELR